jgi:hypothetical protein
MSKCLWILSFLTEEAFVKKIGGCYSSYIKYLAKILVPVIAPKITKIK